MRHFIASNQNHFLHNLDFNLSYDDDVHHIALWLNEYSGYTYVTYRIVVLRFYLWLKHKHLLLKNVQRINLLEYIEFMQDPNEDWIGKRRPFLHPEWRPFRKPVCCYAIQENMRIIRQLYHYLYNSSYLNINPARQCFKFNSLSVNNLSKRNHCLTRKELNLIGDFIAKLPDKTDAQYYYKIRSRWIFQLLLFTGCRKSELSNATMDDFIIVRNKLWLQVIGKGNKYGRIPILTHLELRLNWYRSIYNLPAIRDKITSERNIPLIIMSKYSEKEYKPVTHDYIYYSVKSICRSLANTLLCSESIRNRLRLMSPHWLRHTSATIQIDSGIDIRTVQANLRHSSISTTLLYLHLDDDIRHHETVTKFVAKNIS